MRGETLVYPIRSFRTLFHIGTMDPSQKKKWSLEGAGLSVTTHPEAWRRITPLSGTIFQLVKSDNQFLNYHKMKKAHRQEMEDWGIQQGYLRKAPVYRVTWYDDEMEQEVYTEYTDREKALVEADGERDVKLVQSIISTPKMDVRVFYGETVTSSSALQLLSTIYAEDVLHLDGVWWQDRLDVERLSAPRGSIFASKLSSWTIKNQ